MPIVNMPNGDPVSFPDTMPPDQIKGLIASKFPDAVKSLQPAQPQAPGLMQRIGADFGNIDAQQQAAADRFGAGDQGELHTYAQIIGDQLGKAGAVGNELIRSGINGINAITPDPMYGPSTAQTRAAIANSAPGQFVQRQIGNVGNFINNQAQAHPVIAGDVQAAGNALSGIGTLAGGAGYLAKTGVADAIDAAALNTVKAPIQGTKNIASGIMARTPEILDQAAKDMKTVSSGLYKQSEAAGAVLTPEAGQNIVKSLDGIVPESHTAASQSLYGKTISAIQGLRSDVENGDVSLQTLDRHRQILGNLAKDITNPNLAQEAEAAGRAIDAIDESVNGLGPKDIQNQDTGAIDALNQARAQWSKAKKFEAVSGIIQKAGGDQAKIKQGFTSFIANKKNMIGFLPAEREALRVAATNNFSEKIMKGLGRFGVEPGNVFLPIVTEGMAAPAGHAVGGGGLIAAGTVTRQANKYIARGKAENVLKTIERR